MTLPKWLNDLIINVILPFAKIAGKNAIVEFLKNFRTKEPNWYNTIIVAGYRVFVVHIKPVSDDTATPYDNEAVDTVIAAIVQSASDNNVPLPDVAIIPKALPPTP